MASILNLTARPGNNGSIVESMDTSSDENIRMVSQEIDSSVGSMFETNNATSGEDVTGIRESDMNRRIATDNFVNRVNSIVGGPRTQIQRRRMRDLQLNRYYKILAIKPINTGQYGRQILAHSISFEENEEFKVFLPSRMIPLFPDEEAINQFLSRITGFKVLSLAENNSVNLEFVNNREADDEVDNIVRNNNDDEFFSSPEVLNIASREELRNQLIRLQAERRCRICLNSDINMVFACGHGACRPCAESVDECHICRRSITVRIPIYR